MPSVPRFSDVEGASKRVAPSRVGPSSPRSRPSNDEGGRFVDRNLFPVKTAEAFVPTPAEPVRMRFKMAGGC